MKLDICNYFASMRERMITFTKGRSFIITVAFSSRKEISVDLLGVYSMEDFFLRGRKVSSIYLVHFIYVCKILRRR